MKDSTCSRTEYFKKLLTVLFWLAVWYAAYAIVGKEYIIPSPFHTLKRLGGMILTGQFYVNVLWTMGRVAGGLVLSFALGAVSAAAAHFVPAIRQVLTGPVVVLKSVPVMSVIMLAILALPTDGVSVFVCFLMCYPVVYTNLLSGLDSVDRSLIEMCQVYGIHGKRRFQALYWPSIRPFTKAALVLSAGLSWKTVVASEIFAVPRYSMGYHLLSAKTVLAADELFAWTIAIVILSFGFEKALKALLERERKAVPAGLFVKDGADLPDEIREKTGVREAQTAVAADCGQAGNAVPEEALVCGLKKTRAEEVCGLKKTRVEEVCGLEKTRTEEVCGLKKTRAEEVCGLKKTRTEEVCGLKFFGVDKSFDDLELYRGFSLAIPAGGVTAITGPSGCGKTTLLRMAAGLEPMDGGSVLFGSSSSEACESDGGQRAEDLSVDRRLARVSVVFQEDRLLPWLTVRDNLRLVAGSDRVEEVLKLMGLSEFGAYLPEQLSGGMRRRAAMGRALVYDGAVTLMDEPFTGLDPELKHQLRQEIKRLWKQQNRTVLFITHDREDCDVLADHIYELSGRPVEARKIR